MSSITYWSVHSIEQTRPSALDVVPEHDHDWLFGYGAGNGVHCRIGAGHPILFDPDSNMVASFLECSRANDRFATANWLRMILNPDSRRLVKQWLFETGFPDDGFTIQEEFFQCLEVAETHWDEIADEIR